MRQCKAPELNLPERMADVGPDTLSVANTKWWQFYGDTLLCRIIERTLSHNKDLLGAAANVERMRQLYRVSKAEQLPVFSAPVYAEYETNDYSGESPVRDPELGAKLTAEWELDLWGNCAGHGGRGMRNIWLRSDPTSDAHVLGGRSSHGLFPADRHG